MSKYVVIGIVLAFMGLSFINVISSAGEGATTEQSWISLDTDINVSYSNGLAQGCVRVNVTDVVTINWNKGSTGADDFAVYIFTTTRALNWSSVATEASGWRYGARFKGDPINSVWVRVSSYDVILVQVIPSSGVVNPVTFNVTRKTGLPDQWANITTIEGKINEMNSSINENMSKLNAAFTSSLNALNSTLTNAIIATNSLLNATNTTITANLNGLWASYLENLTATNNEMLSNYQNLMDYTNQSFDILMANLNALDAYTKALNTSYQNNLTLIHAYMAFTNASIELLNDQLTTLADTEESDIAAVTANLNIVQNYTIRANDLLTGLLNMADANSTARDAALNASIQELQTMAGNLSARAGRIESDLTLTNQTLTNDLNAEVLRLNFLVSQLQKDLSANRTALDKQITDAKKEGQNNLGLAVVLTFIAAVCVTLLAITAHKRSHNQKMAPEDGRPKDEEE